MTTRAARAFEPREPPKARGAWFRAVAPGRTARTVTGLERGASVFLFFAGSEAATPARLRLICLGFTAALLLEWTKQFQRGIVGVVPAALCVAAACLLVIGRVRLGSAAAFAVALWGAWFTFPTTPNHDFALLLALAWCAAWSFGKGEGNESALRWLGVTLFFWAGVQKLLHQGYWNGSFFAEKLASGDARFGWLGFIAGDAELARLSSIGADGPFLLEAWPLLAVSRAIPWLEIGLSLGLLSRKWRTASASASLMFVVFAQLAAGEMTFALTGCALFSVFFDDEVARWLVAVLGFAALGLGGWLLWSPGAIVN